MDCCCAFHRWKSIDHQKQRERKKKKKQNRMENKLYWNSSLTKERYRCAIQGRSQWPWSSLSIRDLDKIHQHAVFNPIFFCVMQLSGACIDHYYKNANKTPLCTLLSCIFAINRPIWLHCIFICSTHQLLLRIDENEDKRTLSWS